MDTFISRIFYTDQDSLNVTFSYLIFKVESINQKYGSLASFVEAYELWGETNGKLYILCEMVQPHDMLATLIYSTLSNLDFKEYEDYVFGYELLTSGVDGYDSDLKDPEEIPALKDVDWLGSFITKEKNIVWYRNIEDWDIYAEWRKENHPQYRFNEFQLLLMKYYEREDSRLSCEPILIEFRYDDVIYSFKSYKEVYKIRFETLNKFREQLGEFWYLEK
jgi:hypothetical protein